MAKVAPELQYSDEHEWVARRRPGTSFRSVFPPSPRTPWVTSCTSTCPRSARTVTAGETCGEVESTKSVSDLYAPVTGEVTEVNPAVVDDPALINSDPYGAGWLFKVAADSDGPLLSAAGLRGQERRRAVSAAGAAGTETAFEQVVSPSLDADLSALDPEIAAKIDDELTRQRNGLEMIASENHTAVAVMQAQGSVLTNKYAEGYPGKRYYGGCEHVDVIEQLAIDRVKALFGAEYANVQPHSGAQANASVMHALIRPGDTIMGLNLAHGGHLTHGMKINFSGRLYNVIPYQVREDDHRIDMAEVERLAHEHKPAADRRRLVRVRPAAGLRRVPPDRRRGGRLPDGGHGALRRAGRGRAAPVAGAARARHHVHHAQDPRRSARRHHPHQRRRTSPRRSTRRCSRASRADRWST